MPWIGKYAKRDGTEVSAHWRSPAGAKTQTALFCAVAVLVVGMSGGNGSDAGHSGKTPKPGKSSVDYPIKFERSGKERKPEPQPTVSYPIKFPSSGGDRR
ncbi:hypothetical protein [Streptomyces sp. BRA346]|uniref:hypothetical protein n=1 Tax=Streptomyces sp. BRA346 TaxID=2878199 RepID=UPI00406354D2